MRCKKEKDHLGNEFISLKEMLKHYDLDRSNYYRRKERGWSLEKILTTKKATTGRASEKYKEKHHKKHYDHLGNEYNSVDEMCKYYGIGRTTYIYRMNHDWPLKYALTIPENPSILDIIKKMEELEARINHML